MTNPYAPPKDPGHETPEYRKPSQSVGRRPRDGAAAAFVYSLVGLLLSGMFWYGTASWAGMAASLLFVGLLWLFRPRGLRRGKRSQRKNVAQL